MMEIQTMVMGVHHLALLKLAGIVMVVLLLALLIVAIA